MILGVLTSSPKFAVPIEQLGKMIGLLCNGSTTDFDSVCLGSNPGNPTFKRRSSSRLPFFVLPTFFAAQDYPVLTFLAIPEDTVIYQIAKPGTTMRWLFIKNCVNIPTEVLFRY